MSRRRQKLARLRARYKSTGKWGALSTAEKRAKAAANSKRGRRRHKQKVEQGALNTLLERFGDPHAVK